MNLNQIEKVVKRVENLSEQYRKMSNIELRNQTLILRIRLKQGETLNDILPEAFATAREASYRVNGEYPYHVQLMGGYVLHNGDISEQATGEGKTLTSVLPAYLNALGGNGVHIVTVNEYLAQRDAYKNGKIFDFLGLSVGLNKSGLSLDEKRKAYNCDITYSTNSELGFDYLRDNMVTDKSDRVMRGLNYAIVDEIDSILIDDAITPLIISGEATATKDLYYKADRVAKSLVEDKDYTIDLRDNICILSEDGVFKVEKLFGLDNLYSADNTDYVRYIKNALQANYIMEKDVDYVVDKEILIVDPNTGRTMEGRQWSNGLHQAVEAKEGLDINSETKTVASITYQNFFRMYKKLSGISGTAKTEEEEFLKTYNMYVISLPTNKPIKRIDYPDFVYGTKRAKYKAVIEEINRLHKTGQPILVGTVSIEDSELISSMLDVPHTVLNAKNHELEAEIIKNAGQKGAVTIATNMAGRGTDIKLCDGVKELGGLAVIGTERHKSKRIDDQLRGRSGRQGDPGFSRFYVSLEDDLMVQYGSERLEEKFSKIGDKRVDSKQIIHSIDNAQRRVEGLSYDSRKSLLDYDDVLRLQRETIYKVRDSVLLCDNVHDYVRDVFRRTVVRIVDSNEIIKNTKRLRPESLFDSKALINMGKEETIHFIYSYLIDLYERKIEGIVSLIYPIERSVLLKYIDSKWSDQITIMDDLKNGIGLRGYAQIDPLKAYVEEGYKLFEQMMNDIDESFIRFLLTVNIVDEEEQRNKTCCFIGKKLSKLNRKEDEIKEILEVALQVSINEGFNNFICAMDENVGLWASKLILKYKKTYPSITLTCVFPYTNYENNWSVDSKEEYKTIVNNIDYVYYISNENYKDLNKDYLNYLLDKAYRIVQISSKENIKDRPMVTDKNSFYLI